MPARRLSSYRARHRTPTSDSEEVGILAYGCRGALTSTPTGPRLTARGNTAPPA
jgi:hypothetical protein